MEPAHPSGLVRLQHGLQLIGHGIFREDIVTVCLVVTWLMVWMQVRARFRAVAVGAVASLASDVLIAMIIMGVVAGMLHR